MQIQHRASKSTTKRSISVTEMKPLNQILLALAVLEALWLLVGLLGPIPKWLTYQLLELPEIIVGIFYVIGHFIISYGFYKDSVRTIEEASSPNSPTWEVPPVVGLAVLTLIGFIEASGFVSILLLSRLIGFKLELHLVFLSNYGLLAGLMSSVLWVKHEKKERGMPTKTAILYTTSVALLVLNLNFLINALTTLL